MNGENPLPLWARNILIGVGLFLSGAILAFGYSYRPLHGALSWQVDQLESRLDESNLENLRLRDTLAAQQSDEATRIDPETLAQVERELEQTKRVLAEAEKDLNRADRKRKDANASAATWRKRFKELEGRPNPVAAVSPPKGPTPDDTKEVPTSPASESSKDAAPAPLESNSTAAALDGSQATPESGIMPAEVATESKAP